MNEIKERHRKLLKEMIVDLKNSNVSYILFIENNKITKLMRKETHIFGNKAIIKYKNFGGNTANVLFDNQLLVLKERKIIDNYVIQNVNILFEQAKHFINRNWVEENM